MSDYLPAFAFPTKEEVSAKPLTKKEYNKQYYQKHKEYIKAATKINKEIRKRKHQNEQTLNSKTEEKPT